MKLAYRLVLASASPRRREILTTLGLTFDVMASHIDETQLEGEKPTAYVERVAGEKAADIRHKLGSEQAFVLAADTTVVVDGLVLAKPEDDADGRRMLEAISGRDHDVVTAVVVLGADDTAHRRTVATRVSVRELDRDTIDRYVASGEGRDKAGGYAIQGIGAGLVTEIEGSYTNVVGLPATDALDSSARRGRPSRMAMSIAERLAGLEARIGQACERSGRARGTVRLIAVSKKQPAALVREAYEAGVRDFAENYVQELAARVDATSALPGIRWRFVGHLQRNKVNIALKTGASIDTVDSAALAETLARRATGAPLDVLIQVNVGGETQKAGCAPAEVGSLVAGIRMFPELTLRGLFTVPPAGDAAEDSRPYFKQLAKLAHEHGLADLSMGMSADFEIAIEEGATMVRIGTDLFGAR